MKNSSPVTITEKDIEDTIRLLISENRGGTTSYREVLVHLLHSNENFQALYRSALGKFDAACDMLDGQVIY